MQLITTSVQFVRITACHTLPSAAVVVSFQASLMCCENYFLHRGCEREDNKHNGRRSDRVLDKFTCFRSRQCMFRPFGEFGNAQMTAALISVVYESLLKGVGKLGVHTRGLRLLHFG